MPRPTFSKRKPGSRKVTTLVAVAFWLGVWELLARIIGEEILLVSPLAVLFRLVAMVRDGEFWISLSSSLARIALGFLLSLVAGMVLAVLSYRSEGIRLLFSPLLKTIKTIPVASYIILLLIWIPSRNLSVATSFLMCFPIIYSNALEGLLATDTQLLEMADLFQIPWRKRIVSIYLSQLAPFLESALKIGLGLAWKSGVAAEVIGLPDHTIGDHLYQAKTYLDTAGLFAWTLAICLLSVLCEKLVLYLFTCLEHHLEVSA